MKTIPLRAISPAAAGPQTTAPAPASPPPWRWHWLLAAPHRLAFFAGAVLFAASGLWWAAVLAGWQLLGVSPAWAVPAATAHGLWMAFGFMPLFFCGFLFTAGPKWLGMPPVQARALLKPIGAMVVGWVGFVAGVHAAAWLAGLGVALVALGWGLATVHFARLVAHSPVADRLHATFVLVGCSVGLMALAAAAVGLGGSTPGLVRAATQFGLWGGLALVYVAVVHRMVPFFSASALPLLDAWRPTWLLWTMATGLLAEAPLAALDAWGVALPPVWRGAQAVAEGALAALLLWLAVRWGLVQSLRIRLLAMLHLGFVWLGLAFALQAVTHGLQAAGSTGLGVAPLHALTAGFLGSLLLAMATRVSAGHSGRALAADDIAWGLFWLLQAAVVARVLAALLAVAGIGASGGLTLLAGVAWAAAALGWALRHGGWYGRPRADGRPG